MPTVILDGDNQDQRDFVRPYIMARKGTCIGMSDLYAVWRFGMLPNSEAAHAYGIWSEDFTWVLSHRTTGEVISSWQGPYMNLPGNFRMVLDWGDDVPS